MKTRLLLPLTRALGFAACAFLVPTALAVTFTSDTTIPAGDTTYDGQDVVVSNCTLTVDGPHGFAGLRVAAGGTLTHSQWPGGVFSNLLAVAEEPHTLGGTNIAVLLQSNVLTGTIRVTEPAGSLHYTNGTDYMVHDLGSGWTGLERTTNSAIPDGGMVRVSYDALLGTFNAGLDLSVAGDLEVEAGARISADGKGFAGNSGPGKGAEAGWPVHSGGGAGHGGYGGVGWTNTPGGEAYGAVESPTTLGSGGGAGWGGPGGAGGGAIRLVVGGRAIINGTVSANGANGLNTRSGGGSGGSVWVTAETLAGSGSITANGGNGEPLYGGGGGGGRIALEAATNLFAGGLSARGGSGYQHGGAGTVWTKVTGSGAAVLTVDNGGAPGAITPFANTNTPALVVSGGAVACPIGQQALASLTVHSNAWLSVAPHWMTLDLVVSGNALLAAGGGIDVTGKGHPGSRGPGAGTSILSGCAVAGSGAGHGGYGGMGVLTNLTRGVPYDALDAPAQPGSGGGGSRQESVVGGAGGGAVRLVVGGTLQLDGSVKADGEASPSGNGGGGSGGSVWLTAARHTRPMAAADPAVGLRCISTPTSSRAC